MKIQIGAAIAGAASLLAMGLLAPSATAGTTFSISVDDTSVTVEQTFTVTGSVPNCPNSPYTVTFSYTNVDNEPATETAEGTTDDEGGLSQQITVPDDALPDEAQDAAEPTPPSVQATVECGGNETVAPSTEPPSSAPPAGAAPAALPAAPAKAQQSPIQSNTVTMSIVFADGVLTTDKPSGRAGTVVHVSGTNCLGSQALAALANDDGADVFDVTLNDAANTFAADYTVPNFPPGSYVFAAFCNGTQFNTVPFTLLATPGASSPTPLPSEKPPVPIVGPVNFTG
jgi:hypothetical protein